MDGSDVHVGHMGIGNEALDNRIRWRDDPNRSQAVCDSLSAEKIDSLLRKWLRKLAHPFTAEDPQAGYRYQISILQSEFSLTVLSPGGSCRGSVSGEPGYRPAQSGAVDL